MSQQKWYKIENGLNEGAIFDLNNVICYSYRFSQETFFVTAILHCGREIDIFMAVDFLKVKEFISEIIKE